MSAVQTLRLHCKTLRLPTMAQVVEETLARSQREDWPLDQSLLHLFEQELAGRQRRRIGPIREISRKTFTRITAAAAAPVDNTATHRGLHCITS